ncbi:MAG: hypothetical protein HOW73_27480 [Polyangiaceae bacterium]|nr:hypothetical protein [Polyangiaceae bacterium]
MDLIVGHDLTTHGDDAVRTAFMLSDREGGLSTLLVYVVTQQELDKTGALSFSDKQQVAVEKAYPELWRRLDMVLESRHEDADKVEVDVVVRSAPVHLVRSQAKIAEVLLEIARDFSASRIVLGRKGRPDCVAEHVLEHGSLAPLPDGAPHKSLVVKLSTP